MALIDPKRVNEIAQQCLSDKPDAVAIRGIVRVYSFSKDTVQEHAEEIVAMLKCLPSAFQRSGGMSFLNACIDSTGEQWTGEHTTMEALFCLGKAIGRVTEPMPPELWNILPGGVPYYTVIDED